MEDQTIEEIYNNSISEFKEMIYNKITTVIESLGGNVLDIEKKLNNLELIGEIFIVEYGGVKWHIPMIRGDLNAFIDVNDYKKMEPAEYVKLRRVARSGSMKELFSHMDELLNDETHRVMINKLRLVNKNANLKDMGMFEIKRFNQI